MTQIMTLGEVLIDLTQTGTDEKGIPQFKAFPGGAPANVAVAASRLGAKAGFIGKVGTDAFGAGLRKTLEEDHVDVANLFETDQVPTTLAIVSVDKKGERSFSFYRNPGADTQLTLDEAVRFLEQEELPYILHFGSLSLTTEPSRRAALAAAESAREKGLLISYDPNYREALWDSLQEAVYWMKTPLDMVDILKISDEELVLLTGTDDLEAGSKILGGYGIKIIMITLGSKGVFCRLHIDGEADDQMGIIPAIEVQVSDTNGAGDTFLGAVLSKLAAHIGDNKNMDISWENMQEILAFANRAAAITCSRAGAIPAMPTIDELGE